MLAPEAQTLLDSQYHKEAEDLKKLEKKKKINQKKKRQRELRKRRQQEEQSLFDLDDDQLLELINRYDASMLPEEKEYLLNCKDRLEIVRTLQAKLLDRETQRYDDEEDDSDRQELGLCHKNLQM